MLPLDATKICTKCPEVGPQPVGNFHRCRKLPTALWHYHSHCKKCATTRQRKYRRGCYSRPSETTLPTVLIEAKRKGVKAGFYNHNGIKIPFTIKINDLKVLIADQSIDGSLRCAATRVVLNTTDRSHPLYPSIDRIDNNHGYEPSNIRITSRLYNLARNTWTDIQTIESIAQALASRNRGR